MYTASFLMHNLTGSQIAVVQINIDNLVEPNPDLTEPVECSKQWTLYEEAISDIKGLINKYCSENRQKK